MIGDWINIKVYNIDDDFQTKEYFKPFRVVAIGTAVTIVNFTSDKESYRILPTESIEPIPLTPEILEKNGFAETIWNGKDAWTYRNEQNQNQYLCIDGRDGGSMHFGYLGLDSKITLLYVHELQHALRLCGIEKEITL